MNGTNKRSDSILSNSSRPNSQTPKGSATTQASKYPMEGRAEGLVGACPSLLGVLPMQSQHMIPVRDLAWHPQQQQQQQQLALFLADIQACLVQYPEGLSLAAPCIPLMLDRAGLFQSVQQVREGIQQQQRPMVVLRAMLTLVGMGEEVVEGLHHTHMVMVVRMVEVLVLLVVAVVVVAMVLMEQLGVRISFNRVLAGVRLCPMLLLHILQLLTGQLGMRSGGDHQYLCGFAVVLPKQVFASVIFVG